jgi:hypothetical protein
MAMPPDVKIFRFNAEPGSRTGQYFGVVRQLLV